MMFKTYPKIIIRHNSGIASYLSRWGFWRYICLGNWAAKEEWEEFDRMDDFDLTVAAIQEETIHFVLEKNFSLDVCQDFDNLTFELRTMIVDVLSYSKAPSETT